MNPHEPKWYVSVPCGSECKRPWGFPLTLLPCLLLNLLPVFGQLVAALLDSTDHANRGQQPVLPIPGVNFICFVTQEITKLQLCL